jgi:hypothetical protein
MRSFAWSFSKTIKIVSLHGQKAKRSASGFSISCDRNDTEQIDVYTGVSQKRLYIPFQFECF